MEMNWNPGSTVLASHNRGPRSASGLYYYGYRYYDSVTGRWPSRDPIGEIEWIYEELVDGGSSLYSFGWNDAVNAYDFLGLEAEHTKNKRPSSLPKHQKGDARKSRDKAQSEKHKEDQKKGSKADRAAANNARKNSPEYKRPGPKPKKPGLKPGHVTPVLPLRIVQIVIVEETVRKVVDHVEYVEDHEEIVKGLQEKWVQYDAQCAKVKEPDCWECFCAEGFTGLDLTGEILPTTKPAWPLLQISRIPVKSVPYPKVICRNNRFVQGK